MNLRWTRIAWIGLVIASMSTGCAQVSMIPTGAVGTGLVSATPIPPEQVKIYRQTWPEDKNLQEVGIVTVSGEGPEIDEIYALLRKEAGKNGEPYVVDFKLKAELLTRPVTTTSTSSTGGTSTSTSMQSYIAYTASGTLLRRK